MKKKLLRTLVLFSQISTLAVFAEDKPADWINRLSIDGTLEVEVSQSEDFAGVDSSDIVLATAAFGINARINDRIGARLSFLYEEDATSLEVDEGIITLALNEQHSVSMGQMYVPFGAYATNMVSDPLTLELGETRESAVAFNFTAGGMYGALFVYNGSLTEQTAEEKIDQVGAGIGYSAERDGLSYDFGLAYMNNLGDSDGIAGVVETNSGGTVMSQYVGAYIAHANITIGAFNIIAEYLTATDKFAATELAYNGVGAEPSALNLELGYSTELGGMPATWAIGYQATDEALALGHPESKLMAALSVEIMENTALGFEYTQSEDYGTGVGGTGKDANAFTAQFAVGF